MHFTPCTSRNLCTEGGTHCRGCGRSHEEIKQVREITSLVTEFLKRMDYDNPGDFLDYLGRKVKKKLEK